MERWIRWLFGIVAVSGLCGVVAVLLGLDFLDPFFVAGSALYTVALSCATVLWAVLFQRLRRRSRDMAISVSMTGDQSSRPHGDRRIRGEQPDDGSPVRRWG